MNYHVIMIQPNDYQMHDTIIQLDRIITLSNYTTSIFHKNSYYARDIFFMN